MWFVNKKGEPTILDSLLIVVVPFLLFHVAYPLSALTATAGQAKPPHSPAARPAGGRHSPTLTSATGGLWRFLLNSPPLKRLMDGSRDRQLRIRGLTHSQQWMTERPSGR